MNIFFKVCQYFWHFFCMNHLMWVVSFIPVFLSTSVLISCQKTVQWRRCMISSVSEPSCSSNCHTNSSYIIFLSCSYLSFTSSPFPLVLLLFPLLCSSSLPIMPLHFFYFLSFHSSTQQCFLPQSPLMFKDQMQQDVIMVLKFPSNSPVTHVAANTLPHLTIPAVVTVTCSRLFAVNRWHNTVGEWSQTHIGSDNHTHMCSKKKCATPHVIPTTAVVLQNHFITVTHKNLPIAHNRAVASCLWAQLAPFR